MPVLYFFIPPLYSRVGKFIPHWNARATSIPGGIFLLTPLLYQGGIWQPPWYNRGDFFQTPLAFQGGIWQPQCYTREEFLQPLLVYHRGIKNLLGIPQGNLKPLWYTREDFFVLGKIMPQTFDAYYGRTFRARNKLKVSLNQSWALVSKKVCKISVAQTVAEISAFF